MPKKRARSEDSRQNLLPVQVETTIPPYVNYTSTNPPIPTPGAPLTLAELTHVFLFLTGQEEHTYEEIVKQVAQDVKYGTTEEDGMSLFSTLIEMPPEDLYISMDLLEDALQICKIKNDVDVNNMIKYADKYGDKDGYCGYCDFLNITKHAKLW